MAARAMFVTSRRGPSRRIGGYNMSWWGWSDDDSDDDDAELVLASFRRRSSMRQSLPDAIAMTLLDADILSLIMSIRCPDITAHDGCATNATLHTYFVVAAVCSAWRDAVHEALMSKEEQRRLFPGAEHGTLPLCLANTFGGTGSRLEMERPSFVLALPGCSTAACCDNHRVRIVGVGDGTVRRTFGHAGLDETGLYHPQGLALEGGGVLFVADRSNHRVQKLRLSDGKILASATGSGSGRGGLWGPSGIALLSPAVAATRPLLVVADSNNSRLVALDAEHLSVVAIAGRHGDGADELDRPRGVAVGTMVGVVGSGDAAGGRMRCSVGSSGGDDGDGGEGGEGGEGGGDCCGNGRGAVATMPRHEVYVADFGNDRVQVYVFRGGDERPSTDDAGDGDGGGEDVVGVGSGGGGGCRGLRHSRSIWGHAPSGGLRRPFGLAAADGLLYVSEWAAKRVQVLVARTGECLQLLAPAGCGHLGGLSYDAAGRRLLLLDAAKQKLHVWAPHAQRDAVAAEAAEAAERLVAEEIELAAASEGTAADGGRGGRGGRGERRGGDDDDDGEDEDDGDDLEVDALVQEEWARHVHTLAAAATAAGTRRPRGPQQPGGPPPASPPLQHASAPPARPPPRTRPPARPAQRADRSGTGQAGARGARLVASRSVPEIEFDRLLPRGVGHCAAASSGTYRYEPHRSVLR